MARDLLAPIHDWFIEGFETSDLRKAKALLCEFHQGTSMRLTRGDAAPASPLLAVDGTRRRNMSRRMSGMVVIAYEAFR